MVVCRGLQPRPACRARARGQCVGALALASPCLLPVLPWNCLAWTQTGSTLLGCTCTISVQCIKFPAAMARAHQAYMDRHGINCTPEALLTTPVAAEFLTPELDSDTAVALEGHRACRQSPSLLWWHNKRRGSEPGAGSAGNGNASPPTQAWPMPKRMRVSQPVSPPAPTRQKAKGKAKVKAKGKAGAAKRCASVAKKVGPRGRPSRRHRQSDSGASTDNCAYARMRHRQSDSGASQTE